MTHSRLVLSSLTLTAAAVLGFVAACSDDTPSTAGNDAGADGALTPSDSSAPDGSSSDSGSDGASQSEGGTLVGPVGLVYAGRFNNIDQRLVTALLGDDGRILGYDAGANEAIAAGSAIIDGVFSDSFAKAARWTDGTVFGTMYDDGGVKVLLPNEGQHLGIALVGGNMPASGTVAYTLAGATKPTLRNGYTTEGMVTSGSLTAQFAGNDGTRIGFTLNVTMPDGSFELLGNGGATSVGDAGGTFSANDAGFRYSGADLTVTTGAASCAPDAGTCPTSGGSRIVFAGPNAERIVIAYVFGFRHGVAVFTR